MAAMVDRRTVERFARPGCFETGQAIEAAGAVSELAGAYGGAGGFVAGEEGRQFDVWVGVRQGELVGECDCPELPGLCPHAVAVALAAVRQGVRWAPEPSGDGEEADPASAYDALTAPEKSRVLDELVREQPGLGGRARELAAEVLSGSRDGERLRRETAAAVESALRALDIARMDTGYRPGRGYMDEYTAAGDLVHQALEPFERDVARRLDLGFVEAAREVALGVLDGLGACEGAYDGDEVLAYAGEDLRGGYGFGAHELLRKAGVPLPADEDD